MIKKNGKERVIIKNVQPEIECGDYPAKRVFEEAFHVSADVFSDGHDEVKAVLLFHPCNKKRWMEAPMCPLGNDRWEGVFTPADLTDHEYTIEAWVDHFSTWQHDLKKKFDAGQNITVELEMGADMVRKRGVNQKQHIADQADRIADELKELNDKEAVIVAISEEVTAFMNKYDPRENKTVYDRKLKLQIDRKKALFSSWYEFFPRSAAEEDGRHGTFKDAENILPEIAAMGFDVVYLPPVHPIGKTNRKGKNNALTAKPDDPGSPWAIGSEEGGHKSIHPALGGLKDFRSFCKKAEKLDMEVALDIAFQCSPDHPYVKEHPEWFKWRPDGSVQFAENPPKKYEDILPLNFESEDWKGLWKELKSVIEFWISQGVKIFRVDNPHTKSFRFWEWTINEIRKKNPEVIFLAEAFTRPRIMEYLAKTGFNQSYTYFTWRNTKEELQQYLYELTKTELREYYRPNFWPNTPDILPVSLQDKGEPAFISRLVLAATLSSNYGIYGPVFEFGLNKKTAKKEEYIDNEKYEIKHWNWSEKTKVKEIITMINKVRKENPALQTTWNLHFTDTDNPKIIGYVKQDDQRTNQLLIVVNLDENNIHSGWLKMPLDWLNIQPETSYKVHDLFTGDQYNWHHEWNFIELDPQKMPVHVFRIEKTDHRSDSASTKTHNTEKVDLADG